MEIVDVLVFTWKTDKKQILKIAVLFMVFVYLVATIPSDLNSVLLLDNDADMYKSMIEEIVEKYNHTVEDTDDYRVYRAYDCSRAENGSCITLFIVKLSKKYSIGSELIISNTVKTDDIKKLETLMDKLKEKEAMITIITMVLTLKTALTPLPATWIFFTWDDMKNAYRKATEKIYRKLIEN